MKKVILFFSFSLIFFNCGSKEPKPIDPLEPIAKESPESLTSDALCIAYNIIDKTKIDDLLNWIKIYQGSDLLCKTDFLPCVAAAHKLNATQLTALKNAYPNAKTFDKTWSDIQTLIKDQNCNGYIHFKYDSKGDITDIEYLANYSKTEACYSIRLLKAVGLNLKSTDVFHFFRAGTNGGKVIFNVNNETFGYDYSDDPLNIINPI